MGGELDRRCQRGRKRGRNAPTGIDRETRACAIQGTRCSWQVASEFRNIQLKNRTRVGAEKSVTLALD
jgi:hypothetical protein